MQDVKILGKECKHTAMQERSKFVYDVNNKTVRCTVCNKVYEYIEVDSKKAGEV